MIKAICLHCDKTIYRKVASKKWKLYGYPGYTIDDCSHVPKPGTFC